jgi:hypothetical protein
MGHRRQEANSRRAIVASRPAGGSPFHVVNRRLSALLLVLALGSCVSPPRASVVSGHGTVRAPTTEEARAVADLLEDLMPRLRALLPCTRDPKVEVWLQDELKIFWMLEPSQEVVALNFDAWDRIHLKRSSSSLPEDLSHELVHLMLDSSWSALPPVLEEGLADHVGLALNPGAAADFRAGRLLSVVADLGGYSGRIQFAHPTPSGAECLVFRLLQPPSQPVKPLDALRPHVEEILPHSRSSAKSTLYGLGFLVVSRIVDRIGYDGLNQESRAARARGEAKIAPARLLSLANLDDQTESWVEAALDELGQPELAALVAQQAGALAGVLAEACAPLFTGLDADDFLSYMRPALALRREGPEVLLGDVPAFRDALRGVWPSNYSGASEDPETPIGLRAEQ